MRRARMVWIASGLALVCVLGTSLWFVSHGPRRVTRANFDKIQNGMTDEKVEAILGPPGDYRAWLRAQSLASYDDETGNTRFRVWVDEGGGIMVRSQANRVVFCSYAKPLPFLLRVRIWFSSARS
jgi:hypothetical protein